MLNTTEQTLEWETLARAWVSAFPEAKHLNISQVELWINSNFGSLPPDLQSMPRSELISRLLSIQNHLRLPSHSQVSLQPSNNGTTLKVQKDVAKKPAALLSIYEILMSNSLISEMLIYSSITVILLLIRVGEEAFPHVFEEEMKGNFGKNEINHDDDDDFSTR
ncbi:hypothetical protein Golob_008551 [Gossypium lobatum]|uniref:Uncharacterized protein n=1 Tax=Gossypium lobatum TaxID=34289 RepID=A0A7J8MFS2_9ROSI|nr:hypothetical protein [Gossypium lobatum]